MIAVVLRPPMADTKTSRPSEPSISRRTSWKKDIRLRRPSGVGQTPSLQYSYDAPHLHSIAPRVTFQFHCATRWPGDEKHYECNDRSNHQRKKEGTGESHPALTAT